MHTSGQQIRPGEVEAPRSCLEDRVVLLRELRLGDLRLQNGLRQLRRLLRRGLFGFPAQWEEGAIQPANVGSTVRVVSIRFTPATPRWLVNCADCMQRTGFLTCFLIFVLSCAHFAE